MKSNSQTYEILFTNLHKYTSKEVKILILTMMVKDYKLYVTIQLKIKYINKIFEKIDSFIYNLKEKHL